MQTFKRRLAYYAGIAHRITGLGLFGYLFLHVVSLLSLHSGQAKYREVMDLYTSTPFLIAEWLLGVFVFYHAFNGLRLIAIELFGHEGRQKQLFWWVLALMVTALIAMAAFIIRAEDEEESVRYVLFALGMIWLSVAPVYLMVQMFRLGLLRRNPVWKFQRLTGLLLVILVVGHYAFMHLTFFTGHDYETIIQRLAIVPLRFVDFLLLVVAFWHGAYGATTVLKDHLVPSARRFTIEFSIYAAAVVFVLLGAYTLAFLPTTPQP